MIPFQPFSKVVGGHIGRHPSDSREDLLHLKQIHSDRIFTLERKEDLPALKEFQGDAIVCVLPNLPIAVKTADCVPILLAHPQGPIAAVHAGWRGTQSRILEKTIRFMQEKFGADPSLLKISIGPSICGECYEVGEEVARHFLSEGGPNAVKAKGDGKYLLDLKKWNFEKAKAMGISASQIEFRQECTLCDERNFFSFRGATRRGESNENRNYSWMMRKA
ncbi:MAG: peptidoglycan editing factor PgeF [bacterium]